MLFLFAISAFFTLALNSASGNLQSLNQDNMISIKRNLPVPVLFARELRKSLTPEERIMWDKLKGRRLLGYKFLRQHPLIIPNQTDVFYIADFYCAEKKLVVEIDGLIHIMQKDYDKARDDIMKEMGLTVIRLQNEEINIDVYQALGKIKVLLRK